MNEYRKHLLSRLNNINKRKDRIKYLEKIIYKDSLQGNSVISDAVGVRGEAQEILNDL